MKNLARAAAVLGTAIAIGVVTVPSASAAVNSSGKAKPAPAASEKMSAQPDDKVYYVSGDAQVTREHGPGNLVVVPDVRSEGVPVDLRLQNESITTGDLRPGAKSGSKNSPVTMEIEGSEQDTGKTS
jgi:hypothetical protein